MLVVAIELVILGLLFAFMIGAFIVSVLTEQKIFLLASFLVLMFAGVLIQSSGGIITGHYYDELGALASIVVPLSDSALYLFSQACFWVGLVVTAWVGLTAAFDFRGNKTRSGSPFSF